MTLSIAGTFPESPADITVPSSHGVTSESLPWHLPPLRFKMYTLQYGVVSNSSLYQISLGSYIIMNVQRFRAIHLSNIWVDSQSSRNPNRYYQGNASFGKVVSPYTFTRLHRLGGYDLVCDHNGVLSQSDNPPMVCFYVRKGLRDYSKECHDHLRISLRIKLACEYGYLNIHNVYNRPSNSGGTELTVTVDSMYDMLEEGQHNIMLGDFNLHHHRWAGSRVGNSANRKSREFYNTFESIMDLLTPQGARTREKAPAHSQWREHARFDSC